MKIELNKHVDVPRRMGDITKEPTGFEDRDDSNISFDDGTRLFTLEPAVSTFTYYREGIKKVVNSAKTVTIDDTTGLHFIYIDSTDTLISSFIPWAFGIGWVLVATIYWRAGGADYLYGDERHGLVMDWATHAMLHNTVGTAYQSGLTGTFEDDNTFIITAGTIYDEDIELTSSEQTTSRILYKDGVTGHWSFDAPSTDYFKETAGIMQYDNNGVLTDVPNGSYVSYYAFATNDTINPIYMIMGQTVDNTLANALTNQSLGKVSLADLPSVEMKPIWHIILKRAGVGESVQKLIDLRIMTTLSTGNFIAQDHGSLGGLSDDDHAQYLLVDGTRAMTSDLDLGTNSITNVNLVDGVDVSGIVSNVTHTGDVTGATALTIGADKVLDSHINWGTGATQVSAVDLLIADAGTIITATEVEGALQENRTAIDLNTNKVTNATHTGDVTGATALTIGVDKVLDSHINWGTGATEVSAVDLVIADAGSIITATEVEGALQENRTAIDLNTNKVTNATHTGDVTGSGELTIGADKVLEDHINWGTGATEVSAVDLLIADAGTIITATEVEGALQENRVAIDLNTDKVTNATHTGEVTGATALTVADNIIDEANLKVNAPTNDHVLTADDGEAGGMKWAASSAGFTDPMTTRGDIIYKNASNVTTRLGAGTADHVLTSDGTDISWAAASSGLPLSGGTMTGDIDTDDNVTIGTISNTNLTGDNLVIVQTSTSGHGASITRDLASASTNSPVLYIKQDNTGDDQYALSVVQDAPKSAVFFQITNDNSSTYTVEMSDSSVGSNLAYFCQAGNTARRSAYLYRDLTSVNTGKPVLDIIQANSGDDQKTVTITNYGAGEGMYINQIGANIGLLVKNSATGSYRQAAYFEKNVSGAGSAVVLVLQNHTSGGVPALEIDQDDISEGFINFKGSGRGSISQSLNSVSSVKVELNGTVYRLALYVNA